MRPRTLKAVNAVKTASLTLVTSLALYGCSSSSAPEVAVKPVANASLKPSLESIRKSYEYAYNQLPINAEMPYEEYQALFEPVFSSASEMGVSLSRSPVQEADGFTLEAADRSLAGHALLVDVTTAEGSYCMASTQALSPDIVPDNLKALTPELPHEFVLVPGSCQDHAQLLASAMTQQ